MEKERLKYIDIAKGIGIFLVVWGHLISDGFIDNLIYSFHMPLFLFLSGYMLRARNVELTSMLVKRRIKQLLLPYFYFSAAYLIWELVVIRESIVGLIYMAYQTITFRGMAPLWFLGSLFFAEMVFLVLIKKNNKLAAVVTILLAIAHLLFGDDVDFSHLSGFISNSLLFVVRTSLCVPILACGYGAAYICSKTRLARMGRTGWLILFGLLLAVCGGVVAATALNVNVHLYDIDNMWLFTITAVAGSMAILALSMVIRKQYVLEELGKNSLLLMAVHYPVTQILKNYTHFEHWAITAIVSFFVSGLLITMICVGKYLMLKLSKKLFVKVKT